MAATFPTVKEPVRVPSEIEHVAEVTGVPASEHEESAVSKPEPETSTTVPGAAVDGFNVTWSPLSPTVKVVDVES